MNPNNMQGQPVDNQPPNMAQQAPQNDSSKGANDAMANLGFTNTMMEHLIHYKSGKKGAPPINQAPQSPQDAQESQGQEETTGAAPESQDDTKLADFEAKMTKSMDDLKSEFEKTRKADADTHAKELVDIHKSLKDILNAEK